MTVIVVISAIQRKYIDATIRVRIIPFNCGENRTRRKSFAEITPFEKFECAMTRIKRTLDTGPTT